ncbi:MAG: LysR substrate-binding domain-containing protein [Halothiobacillaceae bacterium]
MTLTELRYLVAVARERHFGRAAEACFISQPTLSVGIKRLEEELGLRIFERASRTEVRITPAGEKLIEQAQRVLDEAERLREMANAAKDPLVGALRLGVIYTIGPYLLPRLIPALHAKAPDMPLLIEEGYTVELTGKLSRGELDAVILSLPYAAMGVEVLPVYREPFVLAAPATHPLADASPLDIAMLDPSEMLMLGPGHCFRDQVLSICPDCARTTGEGRLQRTLEGGSLETIRMMVASGSGVTVLPCGSASGAAGAANGLVAYRPFADPAPSRDVAVVYRRRFVRREAIDLLAAVIRNSRPDCTEAIA